ncbi:hypothetical protein [Vibrio sp. R78045]|uniref:hypothetical protein n=1 Tax=Vibrio sp. R78045 TaxID=3093868 RepID=UPI0036F3289B
MTNIAPSLTPLYKPAVYAQLCTRPDISLYVALQKDITLSSRTFTLSPNLSGFFGFTVENNQVFVGIPDCLWDLLSGLNFQTFSTDFNYLNLYYQVDEESVNKIRTATGFEDKLHLSSAELQLRIPVRPSNIKTIKGSVVLHLVHMDSNLVALEGEGQTISISKKLSEDLLNGS